MASTYDTWLVVGIIVVVFAIPSMVSAYSESRAPRLSAIALLIGGGLIILALTRAPVPYTFEDIPRAFTRVIGAWLR